MFAPKACHGPLGDPFGRGRCWFTVFTLHDAARVFAASQVEVVFSVIVGVLVFDERLARREEPGIGSLTLSVMGVVAHR